MCVPSRHAQPCLAAPACTTAAKCTQNCTVSCPHTPPSPASLPSPAEQGHQGQQVAGQGAHVQRDVQVQHIVGEQVMAQDGGAAWAV